MASKPSNFVIWVSFQSLIEMISKKQILKAYWSCHIVKALIEVGFMVQVLVEAPTKSQAWKACWPCDIVKALIETCSKSQILKACRQSYVMNFLIQNV